MGASEAENPAPLRLFLCGDVMTGRGVDQLLPTPVDPKLHEDYVTDARDYVRLAEQAHGPIARPVSPSYVWGEALAAIDDFDPALRIVNLETAVTTCEDAWPGKGIHYRMHPAHVGCLAAARIDGCALANNHVLDWGRDGLAETLRVLRAAGLRTAGAGADAAQAAAPAIFEVPGGRVLLFAAAHESSGVPRGWRAGTGRPGVWLLDDLGPRSAAELAGRIAAERRAGDTVLVSLHWGGNWGWAVGRDQRAFAHALVEAGADVVHGHSSHHARAFEVHRGRLILYGCGDFISDYEGIGGHEAYRGDIAVAWLLQLDGGALQALALAPFVARGLSLRRAGAEDAAWLLATLQRECAPSGVRLHGAAGGGIALQQ